MMMMMMMDVEEEKGTVFSVDIEDCETVTNSQYAIFGPTLTDTPMMWGNPKVLPLPIRKKQKKRPYNTVFPHNMDSHVSYESNKRRLYNELIDTAILPNSVHSESTCRDIIFNGPFQETISKLANCFSLLRERIIMHWKEENEQNIGDWLNCGLEFGFTDRKHVLDSRDSSCFSSFRPSFKLKDIFYSNGPPSLVYIDKRDYDTLLTDFDNADENLVVLSPPIGFCFSDNVLTLVNVQMIDLLYECHMVKEFGCLSLQIDDTTKKIGEDFNTCTLITDVWVGYYFISLQKTFTRSFIEKNLLRDLDDAASLTTFSAAHLRRLCFYKYKKCFDCDQVIDGEDSSKNPDDQDWKTFVISKIPNSFELIQSFSKNYPFSPTPRVPSMLASLRNQADERCIFEHLSNLLLFKQYQHNRRGSAENGGIDHSHLSLHALTNAKLNFHNNNNNKNIVTNGDGDVNSPGYCIVMSSPLLNSLRDVIPSDTIINNLLLEKYERQSQSSFYGNPNIMGYFRL